MSSGIKSVMSSTAGVAISAGSLMHKAMGTVTFDENAHIIDTSGIGKKIEKSYLAEAIKKGHHNLGKVGEKIYEDRNWVGRSGEKKDGKTTVYLEPKEGAEVEQEEKK